MSTSSPTVNHQSPGESSTLPPKYAEQPPATPDYGMPYSRLRALSGGGCNRQFIQPGGLGIVDELVRSQQHNTAKSLLHRLPEKILVENFMARLDWLSVYSLRHTSRLFMRLFSDNPDVFPGMTACAIRHTGLLVHDAATGSRNNNGRDGHDDYAPPWATMSFPIDYKSTWPRFKMLISRSLYDSRHCHRQFSTAPGAGAGTGSVQSEYMHCSKCKADHPTRMFSAAACAQGIQAQLEWPRAPAYAPSDGPACIAHQGHVRICEHKTVTYAQVLASLPGGALYSSEQDRLYEPQSLGELFPRAPSLCIPFAVEPHLTLVCDHPSHVPRHQLAELPMQPRHWGQRRPRAGPAPPTMPHDMPPPTYNRFPGTNEHKTPHEHHKQPDYFPSFVVHDLVTKKLDRDEERLKVVTWSYTAHLDLSATPAPMAVQAQDFRDAVCQMRAGHSPARYIAPEDPGILQELRCVDPTRCTCLVYPGWGADGKKTKSCRQHAVVRRLYSRVSDVDQIRTRLDSCSDCRHGRCVKVTYTRTIRLATVRYSVDASPMWKPAVVYHGDGLGRRQRMRPHELNLRLEDAFRNRTVVPYGWYQALDPSSYEVYSNGDSDGSADDSNHYQVTWCRGDRCRLNPRFLREHFVAGQEINAACLHGCCGGPGCAGPDTSLSSTLQGTSQDEPAPQVTREERPPPYTSTSSSSSSNTAGPSRTSSRNSLPLHSNGPFEYPLRDQWDGWRAVRPRPTTEIWVGRHGTLDLELLHDGVDYEKWEKAARETSERRHMFKYALRDLKVREEDIVDALNTEVLRARAAKREARLMGEAEYTKACRLLTLRWQALRDAELEQYERRVAIKDAISDCAMIDDTVRLVREFLVRKRLAMAAAEASWNGE